MSIYQILRLCAIALALPVWCQESIPAEGFNKRVTALYAFSPHLLNKAQAEAKSKELDEFWNQVKAAPKSQLPLLRQELESNSQSAFFHFDGAKLLISLSESEEDLQRSLNSISKTDLRDVGNTDYLRLVHWFASKGLDTTAAAIHILDYPEFKAFIPQHALTLGQDYSLIYGLFTMNEDTFMPALLARLKSESQIISQKSILRVLFMTFTESGHAAIKSFATDSTKPGEARTYAGSLLKELGVNYRVPKPSKVARLKMERQQFLLRGISDEVLYEFDEITRKIARK